MPGFYNSNFRYNVTVMSPNGLLDKFYQDISLAKTKELIKKNYNVYVLNLTLGIGKHLIDGKE